MRKHYTLDQFQDETALLPFLVADMVITQQHPQMARDERRAFAEHVETKLIAVVNHNERFRRMMTGRNRREWLYAFVEHWLAGWLVKRHRTAHRVVDINELFT